MRKSLLFLICVLLAGVSPLYAGSLDDTAAPTDAASRMYTLLQIYNRLYEGTPATKPATAFVEPAAGPVAGTMKTLDDILVDFNADVTTISANAAAAADVADGKWFFGTTGTRTAGTWGPVEGTYTPPPATFVGLPKTTQTSVFHAAGENDLGDDATVSAGYPGKGVAETISRWTKVAYLGNEIMVTDSATGLTWMRRGDMPVAANMDESGGSVTAAGDWTAAFTYVATLNAVNGGVGYGGHSDWRVPNIKELQSIVNYQFASPASYEDAADVPGNGTGYFKATQSSVYWSSTTCADDTGFAWFVSFNDGYVYSGYKAFYTCYVRPVRGGQ